MQDWLVRLLVFLAAVAAVWAGFAVLGRWRWQARTRGLIRALAATGRAGPGPRHDPEGLAGLPPPVQRYLRAALPESLPMVTGVRLGQRGRFNLGGARDRWKDFAARQEVQIARPGFVWDGVIGLAPGLPVRVQDAYVAGQGVLVPSVLGLVPLGALRGGGALAEGEALRWLAEAAWYPTALLPGQGVSWTAIDERSALATLTDGEIRVSLTFCFGPDALITRVRAGARPRRVGDRLIPTPWEGRWSDYRRVAGMMVPMAGEVAWILPEGPRPYWRGTITDLCFRLADQRPRMRGSSASRSPSPM